MRKHRVGAVLAGVACVTVLVFGKAAWQPMNAASGQPGGFGGKVLGANSPIAGSTVTLFAADEGKPVQLAQGKTGDDGAFNLEVGPEKMKGSEGK
ncbi:MAG TPA: hypothetical protein VE988_09470, partial [Gemmataceae bacterium]|nr:hypothetical protein [Gemmataceae bacterium]